MKHIFTLFLLVLIIACSPDESIQWEKSPALIPYPQNVSFTNKPFVLSGSVTIGINADSSMFLAANYLKNFLDDAFAESAEIVEGANGDIRIQFSDAIKKAEGYRLQVNDMGVLIEANSGAGAFYGVQTLLQLFPTEVFSGQKREKWAISHVMIEDEPRFSYRGLHLDVGRHLFPVEFIKKYIDLLAYHKMNRFHWHLTEDQGWRIEIKKYPKLTSVGAFRDSTVIGRNSGSYKAERYGGFYTQEEVREVVQYAAERFVTVVPEIELPGHSTAAIAAYPELGNTDIPKYAGKGLEDNPVKVATRWGVFEDIYSPKEETFAFLEDVLTEVMDLFPSEYIHIGGDEAPKTQWEQSPYAQEVIRREGLKDEHELQSYFITRIERFLNSKGRNIIGWDEILEGGLAPNATVMSWRGTQGGIMAAKAGHDVIMTPGTHCYLDHYQYDPSVEPLAIGGLTTLEKIYSYEPVPEELTEEEARFVLGAQGNVWTEYMPDADYVEYMAYPRATALAEVLWSPKAERNYSEFVQRLAVHAQRLDYLKVNYATHFYSPVVEVDRNNPDTLTLKSILPESKIRFTIDGSDPLGENALTYNGDPILLNKDISLRAVSQLEGKSVGKEITFHFSDHLARGANVTIDGTLYGKTSPQKLVNGIPENPKMFNDGEWVGKQGEDLVIFLDLGSNLEIDTFQTRFYEDHRSWIYLPKAIDVEVSPDGTQWQNFASAKAPGNELLLTGTAKARYVRITVKRHGVISAGSRGEGNEAHTFLGETQIR